MHSFFPILVDENLTFTLRCHKFYFLTAKRGLKQKFWHYDL
jgi:hypothetical protein